jgi:hypothetical protein
MLARYQLCTSSGRDAGGENGSQALRFMNLSRYQEVSIVRYLLFDAVLAPVGIAGL